MNIAIRAAAPSDYGFIIHSGRRELSTLFVTKQRPKAESVLTPVLDAIVRAAKTAVACDAADPDALVGWALANQGTLIFVYVSAAVRGHGIAKRLTEFVAPKEDA